MIVSTKDGKLSVEQIEAFWEVSTGVWFQGQRREEVYGWITQTLRGQSYQKQGKKVRGLIRRYVEKMTGRSRTQVTLLVARYMEHSQVEVTRYRRDQEPRFPLRPAQPGDGAAADEQDLWPTVSAGTVAV